MRNVVRRLPPKRTAETNQVTAKPVAVKRVYETASRSDGTRVLVDRLWPRGLTKERAAVDHWLRDLAPSDALRKWFHARHEIEAWPAFRRRYLKELADPECAASIVQLYRLANRRKKLTLLFASKNEKHNNAIVLRDLLEGMKKPPTGTGPGGVRAVRLRQEKRMPR